MDRRTFSVQEVADSLGVDPQTVRAWIRDGLLEAVQPKGSRGRVLVLAASIDRLLAVAVHSE